MILRKSDREKKSNGPSDGANQTQGFRMLLPPEWNAIPSQGYPPALNLPVPIYTPGWREAL